MPLEPGDVLWADLGGGAGREQEGWRPVVVVSAAAHVAHRQGLVTVVPCTSVERPWRSRVPLRGALRLRRPTFAMTEQVRTIDRSRITGRAGRVDPVCRNEIARTLRRLLMRPRPFSG